MPPRGVKKGTKRGSPVRARQGVQRATGRAVRSRVRRRLPPALSTRSGRGPASPEQRSRTSVRDISWGRRGGKRSGSSGPRGRAREQLYNEAEAEGHQGPVEDDQGPAAARRRGQVVTADDRQPWELADEGGRPRKEVPPTSEPIEEEERGEAESRTRQNGTPSWNEVARGWRTRGRRRLRNTPTTTRASTGSDGSGRRRRRTAVATPRPPRGAARARPARRGPRGRGR